MTLSPSELRTVHRALAAAVDGSGDPVELTESGEALPRPEARHPRRGGHPDAAAVVRTSGSTGTPKQIVLTRAALQASAAATAERLGGAGTWLLAVGVHYVAGLAVLSRSIVAGTQPVAMRPGPFTVEAFADAADRLPAHGPRYVSLVPTQLARLLADGADPAGSDALRGFDRVLVGGARLDPGLRRRAEDAGVRVTATYGMAETCGGCVYDGVPLPGVRVETVPIRRGSALPGVPRSDQPRPDAAAPGAPALERVRLAGPMVAAGYLDDLTRTVAHFGVSDGVPTFLTEDTGRLVWPDASDDSGAPVLEVTGRLDDVLITGGVKVSAAAVQAVLESDPGVAQAHVAGVPDEHWGQRVSAAFVPAGDVPDDEGPELARLTERAGALVRERLGAAAVPKTWLALPQLPRLSTGKTDRRRVAELLAERASGTDAER
ncbi:O-succinylbenzoic acid--CoA ligase [Micrococcus cohnii]|uniref:O-succinylbenzoic acid--CoA ligase n=1 Tax=Micrococcus cohnii TaxID=993416 RepID=A0A7W7GPC5_9MICC|nr:AMP-binding protein [Micrococcus cohnii]MBB4735805.1 O-succinylbenzoic acid--CoA ligase [Micrococcus cohnii]